MTDSNTIKQTPNTFQEIDVIARTAADDLLAKLDWLTIKPKVIVVIGWGCDDLKDELQKKYPEANISAHLNNAEQPVDMLVANLVLPWQDDYQSLLKHWQKAMRPEGVLLLSALGPDTLKECRADLTCVPTFTDMHEIGDALAAEGFSDPVMEVQQYTLEYSAKEKYWQELTAHELWVEAIAENNLSQLTQTFELVYGHAFCADSSKQSKTENGETLIPLESLRATLRSS